MKRFKFVIMYTDYNEDEEIKKFKNDDKAYNYLNHLRDNDDVAAVTFSEL